MAEPTAASTFPTSQAPQRNPGGATSGAHRGRKRRHNNYHGGNWESRRGRPRRHFNNNQRNNRQQPTSVAAAKNDPPACSVCHVVSTETFCANKYKCPKCRAPYCSVACCKQHKENCTAAGEGKPPMKEDGPSVSKYLSRGGDVSIEEDILEVTAARGDIGRDQEEDSDDDSLDDGYKINDAMKTALDRSDWLRNELIDGGLRKIILKIVHSSNIVQENGRTRQEEELERAKAAYPNFELFIDKLLVLAGVLERQRVVDDNDGVTSSGGGGNDTIGNADEQALEEWLNEDHTYEELQQSLVLKPIERPLRPKMTQSIHGSSTESSSSSNEDEESSSENDDDDSDNASSNEEDGLNG